MRVSIPEEKQTAWKNDIKEALASTKTKTDTLESLIGKINQAAHVITPERYFLNWLHHLPKRKQMGTKKAPTMASPRSPTVDKIPPTRDYQGGPDQQHFLCQTISNALRQGLS